MALDCTPAGLVAASNCLGCSLTFKQLLAALVYIQCTSNGMDCTPSTLVAASTQLRERMTEKQLLAALVYIQCTGGGGGSVECGTGAPITPPSGTCGFYIQTDSTPNAGVIWEYFNGAWH